MHRAENTDSIKNLTGIIEALLEIGGPKAPVVMPLHPRTRKYLQQYKLFEKIEGESSILLIEPTSFIDMIALEKHARLILTDSGGVQKEAFFHGVPCVTLRSETEWVELVQSGWNILAGPAKTAITSSVKKMLYEFSNSPPQHADYYGNGFAAEAIIRSLIQAN